jgi:hypothetical protein
MDLCTSADVNAVYALAAIDVHAQNAVQPSLFLQTLPPSILLAGHAKSPALVALNLSLQPLHSEFQSSKAIFGMNSSPVQLWTSPLSQSLFYLMTIKVDTKKNVYKLLHQMRNVGHMLLQLINGTFFFL